MVHAKRYLLVILDLVWVNLWRSILRRKDFVVANDVIAFRTAKSLDRGLRYGLRGTNCRSSFVLTFTSFNLVFDL